MGAPLVARSSHIVDLVKLQRVSNLLVIGAFIPVLAGFLGLYLFGRRILGLFGPGFSSAYVPLVILAFATTVSALAGPTSLLMNMTGHNKEFLLIMAVMQGSALAMRAAAAHFGLIWSAAAVTFGVISWTIWVWQWARRRLGGDPAIYALIEALWSRRTQMRRPCPDAQA